MESKDLLVKCICIGASYDVTSHYYPMERFSSYDGYVNYLKDKGYAFDV